MPDAKNALQRIRDIRQELKDEDDHILASLPKQTDMHIYHQKVSQASKQRISKGLYV